MDNQTTNYMDGYADCLEELSFVLDKSIQKNDNLRTSKNIINVFNDVLTFIYMKLIELNEFSEVFDEFEESLFTSINKDNIKLYLILGGK